MLNLKNILIVSVQLTVVALLVSLFSERISSFRTWYSQTRNLYVQGKYVVYANNNSGVLGATSSASSVSVDFSQLTHNGSPLIFGGTQVPNLEDEDAWSKIRESGVTGLRKDFFLEYTTPGNITVDQYKRNTNGVADPKNWRRDSIAWTEELFARGKRLGYTTMGIVSYAPRWLTYTGTQHGVPKDWEVYEDIVRKLYRTYRNNLDYVQIWNEPTYKYFLDPNGSGLSREEAYYQIFIHATRAVRQVDAEINDGKRARIGAQLSHLSSDLGLARYLLAKEDVRQELNFVSYHHYGQPDFNANAWKNLLAEYNLGSLPIFLTEWNFDSNVQKNHSEFSSTKAIGYTGAMLVQLLREGFTGANYYSLFPLDRAFKVSGHGYTAFYDRTVSGSILLPQAKTWNIMSNVARLGTGVSSVYKTDVGVDVSAVGFENSSKERGIIIVNRNSFKKEVEVTLLAAVRDQQLSITPYVATMASDPSQQVSTTVVRPVDGQYRFTVIAEPDSVTYVKFLPAGVIQYSFDELLRNLFVRL